MPNAEVSKEASAAELDGMIRSLLSPEARTIALGWLKEKKVRITQDAMFETGKAKGNKLPLKDLYSTEFLEKRPVTKDGDSGQVSAGRSPLTAPRTHRGVPREEAFPRNPSTPIASIKAPGPRLHTLTKGTGSHGPEGLLPSDRQAGHGRLPPEKTLDRHLRDDLRLTGNIIGL